MTEITPKAYDIFHPTPVSLKQLSAIAASHGIWRCKLNYHRTNDGLSNFHAKIDRNSLKSMLPDIPSAIFEVIYKYVVRFGISLNSWLNKHYNNKEFLFFDRSKNEILKDFDDFVCDHNGLIHYTRTAEHMMQCSTLNESKKFTIACTYFFEDHIRRIWPNVWDMMNVDEISMYNNARFDWYPQLYYWMYFLNNELNKVSIPRTLSSIDELMFDKCLPNNGPSVEYFWFRIPLERRLQRAFNLFDRNVNSFVKFILQKLDDKQLDEFVERKGCELMIDLSRSYWYYPDEGLFLPTWNYIKSRMSDSNLTNLVSRMLSYEAGSIIKYSKIMLKRWSFYCAEIWGSINSDLKPSIVQSVLSRHELFENREIRQFYLRNPPNPARYVEFLLTILSSVTFEQKKLFLSNCWRRLMNGARVEDLRRIVKLCSKNKREIAEFKRNAVASSRIVLDCCMPLTLNGHFDELNALVDYFFPEIEKARTLKQEILRSFFLGQSSFLNPNVIKSGNELLAFIDIAFNNADLSTDFKNQLMSSPENQEKLTSYLCCRNVPFEALMEFFDLFALTEQTALQIKERVRKDLIALASDPKCRRRDGVFENSLDQLLLWCLGSDEQVATFKRTYSVSFDLPRLLINYCCDFSLV
ncbi:uncharacterized protein LOC135849442 isoform X1 [Planococcus citri]|uniref:uncharacterized protein LOC135849442 isoform X1 n=1 Tax=Planococcus citri TaxID=170843 RepID=UPI0031F7D959